LQSLFILYELVNLLLFLIANTSRHLQARPTVFFPPTNYLRKFIPGSSRLLATCRR